MGKITENNQFKLTFSDIELARQLFGEFNSNLQRIANALDVSINARGNTVFIQGDSIASSLAKNILNQLYSLLENSYPIYPNDVDYAVRILSEDDRIKLKDIFLDTVYVTSKKRSVIPKS
ncbi:MAG: phosphate starvation-inducible protein PhoH, partial [Desulfobulbaceae bacterium]|nr:phosphate starvation-inducible protein PhoH [Desulfobulbaceae bacterium]